MLRRILLAATVSLPLALANAQPLPDYGFDWATIGDPGNPAYDGGFWGHTAGRGSVDYTYRISELEVTTSQWMEFVNTFSQRDGGISFARPLYWGATFDPSYSGPGVRWAPRGVPNWDMLPVAGISWHDAAMYANWLHNGKSSDPAAIENGAYDTATWGVDPATGHRTDGGRLPGAKFWIPSLDEWLKATHYDPHRHGPGEGGWWLYPNSTDEPLTPGRPGVGETMAGIEEPQSGEWDLPLGSYPDVTTPWGLLDASGGAEEWTEEWAHPGQPRERIFNGSAAGQPGWELRDRADFLPGSAGPHIALSRLGIRIASVVPSPGAFTFLLGGVYCMCQRRIR